jgi:hypothetical protein
MMSVKQSYLSSPKYGYALAVGTTQQSINSTMKAYLNTLSQPLVTIVYVADEFGNPKEIPFKELLLLSDGADPFQIPPDANPNTNPDLKKLENARFMVGFRARIGLPPKYSPSTIPDIVTFGLSYTNVTFRLMCSEFTVVNLKPAGGYSPATWFSVSQGIGEAWLFESTVDLLQFTVGSDEYYTLPPDVQKAISQFHAGTFSVQQLLFDLDNAKLQTIPQIKGVEPGSVLYNVLTQYFIGCYFTQLQEDGQPVLGCTITRTDPDRSSLDVTNVQMQVGPYVDSFGQIVPNPTDEQRRLSTLNYLCAVDDQNPLPPVPFSWNWITKEDAADGVVALNRNTFAKYIKDQLYYSISKCCFKPWVRVWVDGLYVYYSWSLYGYQSPNISLPTADSLVLHATHQDSAFDQAGLNGALGKMKLEPSFDVQVTFSGNQITVVQYLKIYVYVKFLASASGGNVVDIKLTNTFTLGVDADGQLTSTMTSERVDHSELPGQNGFLNFFADLNSLIASVKEWAADLADTSFKDLPLSVVQSFIFPGGNTFVFKDIAFSEHQDLVCHVVYADPTVDPSKLHLTRLGRTRKHGLSMAVAANLPADMPLPQLVEAEALAV